MCRRRGHGRDGAARCRPPDARRGRRRRQLRRGRYVAAADGLHSSVRAGLGLGLPPRGPSAVRAAPALGGARRGRDHVEVHWSRDAELYVTPVGDDTVGVAVLTAVARPVVRLTGSTEFPEVPQRLQGASRRPRCGVPDRSSSGPGGGRPVASCWSATRPATSTRSRGRGSRSGLLGAEALWSMPYSPTTPQRYERAWRTHDEDLATAHPRVAARLAGPAGARAPWCRRPSGSRRSSRGPWRPSPDSAGRAQVAPSTSWASNSAGWSDIQSACSTVKPADAHGVHDLGVVVDDHGDRSLGDELAQDAELHHPSGSVVAGCRACARCPRGGRPR